MASVTMTTEAARELEALPLVVHARVLKVLERLEAWPEVSGAKPLRGRFAGQFRIRTGDYRIQFHASRTAVVVVHIGHRDGFYEE